MSSSIHIICGETFILNKNDKVSEILKKVYNDDYILGRQVFCDGEEMSILKEIHSTILYDGCVVSCSSKYTNKELEQHHKHIDDKFINLSLIEHQTKELCTEAFKRVYDTTHDDIVCFYDDNTLVFDYAKYGIKGESDEVYLDIVKRDWRIVKFIEDLTEDLCIKIVDLRPISLKIIEKQTEKICETAVNRDGSVLEYVKNKTYNICLIAVGNCGMALKWAPDKKPELCLRAVKQDGRALQFVEKQTIEMCIIAVRQWWYYLEYVHEKTFEICLEAVKHHGWALKLVDQDKFLDRIGEIYYAAVENFGESIRLIQNPSRELYILASKTYVHAFPYIEDPTENECLDFVDTNKHAIKFIRNQTKKVCIKALNKYWGSIGFIRNQTPEYCELAYKKLYERGNVMPNELWALVNAIKIYVPFAEELRKRLPKQDGMTLL